MDSVAGAKDATRTTFLNFGVDPDGPAGTHNATARLPDARNGFFYHAIGNIGFVGFNGAYEWTTETKPLMAKACAWFGTQFEQAQLQSVFLLGHWNVEGMGCPADMDVPEVYNEIKSLPGCAALGPNLRYLMGHTHCNKIITKDVGFMMAGQGMDGCGNFGLPIVDSTNGRIRIWYYEIANLKGTDNYETLLKCFQQGKGIVDGCSHLATLWLNVSTEEH